MGSLGAEVEVVAGHRGAGFASPGASCCSQEFLAGIAHAHHMVWVHLGLQGHQHWPGKMQESVWHEILERRPRHVEGMCPAGHLCTR